MQYLGIIKFLIILNLFLIPFYAIIVSGFAFLPLQETTASLVYSLFQTTGINAEKDGLFISIPAPHGTWGAFINWDCSGWKSLFVLFALVAATPLPFCRRISGFILLPVIYIINVIRIWFMFYFVNHFGLVYYDFVHAFVWSWGMIFFILFLWLVWLRFMHNNKA